MTTKEYIAKAQEEAREILGVNTEPNDAWHTSIYERRAKDLDTLIAKTITDYREVVVGNIENMAGYLVFNEMKGRDAVYIQKDDLINTLKK